MQRHDLNPIEEANGYKKLMDDFGYDQDKVAKFIGKSRAHIANCLRLLSLPDKVIQLVETNKLSQGHAKILVGLENSYVIAKKILDKKLSVRQSEGCFERLFRFKCSFRRCPTDSCCRAWRWQPLLLLGAAAADAHTWALPSPGS